MTTNIISAKIKTAALLALNGAILLSVCAGPAQTDEPKPGPSPTVRQPDEVRVNGRVLTASQLIEFERLYHIRPIPGDYWYDALSGLYGIIGGPVAGLMYPGHKLGDLKENASAGEMRVFINRRRIPMSEWLVWSAIVGTPVQPGRYWLAANGNVGYEGSAIPLLNLHTIASRNAGGGGSGEHKSVLSTWDRTGTSVFGGVGVLTSGGSWYPGQ